VPPDEAPDDLAALLLETEDSQGALAALVKALHVGTPRPPFDFTAR
jgi:hypothetical protein